MSRNNKKTHQKCWELEVEKSLKVCGLRNTKYEKKKL